MRGKEHARRSRQEAAAQFVEDLRGRPFEHSLTRKQAAALYAGAGILCFIVAFLEWWWRTCA